MGAELLLTLLEVEDLLLTLIDPEVAGNAEIKSKNGED